ncbi:MULTISPECIES: DUF3054 domain-containing protein [Halorussus]|uniref:DUF3054 domain-containing protein n=1 Tax=Halorussus TaxID=1070314 RepID=UPI00209E9BF0|nr:DUF3054 domain-containing protein [Halorussus vallis]USZ75924.1 DUF3054 domain-containing protein [Halorussus vallis]
MSNAEGFLGSRFERSPDAGLLAVGDLLVILAFLTVGELRHGVNPVTQPLVVADTVAPFLLGWVVASLAVGAYAPGAMRSSRVAAVRAAGAWVGAAAIGLALRATSLFHGESPWTFALVVTGIGVVSLVAWRVAVSAVR